MHSHPNFTQHCVRKTDFYASPDLINQLRQQWKTYAAAIPSYPGQYHGRGIVICGGGLKYFTCAWVNISLLRKNGCTLPIELWYIGNELNEDVINAVEALDVRCRNCEDHADGQIESVAMKPFAIMHSSFREVLFLDADNNCVTDPSFLFEHEAYLTYGTMFWPDFWTTEHTNPIWQITGSDAYDSIEQESGQLLINKEKCWRELNLCMFFNRHKDYYYKMLLGDKDTFKFAWLALGTPYYMMPVPVGFCGFRDPATGFHGLSMVQHDQEENVLFMHRSWIKWDITRDDEPLWMEVKRFLPNAKRKLLAYKKFTRKPLEISFWDIEGDIDCYSFTDRYGDFEMQCLDILKELRRKPFYARFLLHNYFNYFRPGYQEGYTGKIFQTEALQYSTTTTETL